MNRLKRHIACLLCGILIIPIAYQSVHKIWHHAHGYEYRVKPCHGHESGTASGTELWAGTQSYISCPVCEYKFSVNDLPKVYLFVTEITPLTSIETAREIRLFYQQYAFVRSPRAPPASVS